MPCHISPFKNPKFGFWMFLRKTIFSQFFLILDFISVHYVESQKDSFHPKYWHFTTWRPMTCDIASTSRKALKMETLVGHITRDFTWPSHQTFRWYSKWLLEDTCALRMCAAHCALRKSRGWVFTTLGRVNEQSWNNMPSLATSPWRPDMTLRQIALLLLFSLRYAQWMFLQVCTISAH